jgi:cytochrome b561
MQAKNQPITDEELKIFTRQIHYPLPMWDWHFYLGYVLTGLFAVRLILPVFGEMKFSNPYRKEIGFKERFQFIIYWVFYVGVAISLITGLMMKFGPRTLKPTMVAIHVLSLYYLVTYIIIHLIGVLIAEFTEQHGIISRTISERKHKDL